MPLQRNNTVILGIDPGLASTGFGAISYDGSTPRLVRCGYIRTSPGGHISHRLSQIHSDMSRLINDTRPGLIAIEKVFSLVKYPKAGLLLGSVLGIIYLTSVHSGVPITEFTPKEVKNSLVGYGNADKKQIRDVIRRMLGISDVKSFHAADALAVALTAFYRIAK